jgi:hypothetical protein
MLDTCKSSANCGKQNGDNNAGLPSSGSLPGAVGHALVNARSNGSTGVGLLTGRHRSHRVYVQIGCPLLDIGTDGDGAGPQPTSWPPTTREASKMKRCFDVLRSSLMSRFRSGGSPGTFTFRFCKDDGEPIGREAGGLFVSLRPKNHVPFSSVPAPTILSFFDRGAAELRNLRSVRKRAFALLDRLRSK